MRLEALCSQREVAKALGISHALVAQAERQAIVKICQALDLPPPYIYVRTPKNHGRWMHCTPEKKK